MDVSTENSTEKVQEGMLEPIPEKHPISVYSVNFTPIINDAEREFLMKGVRANNSEAPDNRSHLSKLIFKRRNAIAIAAILVVGLLHFAFQLSFIRNEKGDDHRVAEVPVKARPQLHEQTVEAPPAPFEVKKTDDVIAPKMPAPVRPRQFEAAPVRPQPQIKKKEPVESRAERLRRAEKILTGV